MPDDGWIRAHHARHGRHPREACAQARRPFLRPRRDRRHQSVSRSPAVRTLSALARTLSPLGRTPSALRVPCATPADELYRCMCIAWRGGAAGLPRGGATGAASSTSWASTMRTTSGTACVTSGPHARACESLGKPHAPRPSLCPKAQRPSTCSCVCVSHMLVLTRHRTRSADTG
jgi:hypothetical protein